MNPAVVIRKAEKADIPSIHQLIIELAVFEKEPEAVTVTVEQMLEYGFGNNPIFIAWVAELDQQIVGAAICYIRYSTWKGPVLYLEDLIVTEKYRQNGIGSALFENCIKYAKSQDYALMKWQVLDWNTPAVNFYKKYGAEIDTQWWNGYIWFHK